jgi:hypothetical protein
MFSNTRDTHPHFNRGGRRRFFSVLNKKALQPDIAML